MIGTIRVSFREDYKMTELLITDVDEFVLDRLREHATRHGRTPVEEAKAILAEALGTTRDKIWQQVDDVFHRLETSGRTFSDSADLLREDRGR